MDYIILDGEILKKHETGFTRFFWEEPFVIHQKCWFGFGGLPLFDENIETLKLILRSLNFEIPALFADKRELLRITKRMLNKNRFFRSGVISYRIFISGDDVHFIAIAEGFNESEFPYSKKGLMLGFSEFEKFSGNPLNRFAFYNAPFWQYAMGRSAGSATHNLVFLNENGKICDCISANIFMVKGKSLVTPSVSTGCYVDTLRSTVIEAAQLANLEVSESAFMVKEDIALMNEIFIASEENGVQYVTGIGNKRFVRQVSEKIHEKINWVLKEKVK